MQTRIGVIILLLLLAGCGGTQRAASPELTAAIPLPGAADSLASAPGHATIAGEAGLVAGLAAEADPTAQLPLPKQAAVAGVDFASDRFVVVYENQPDPAALAPWLGGDATAELIRATDNAPLVANPQLRRVSHNLAAHYGLGEGTRVFFRDVSFSVFTMDGLSDVSQLDAMMRRVQQENRGLIREVRYDFFVSVAHTVYNEGQRVDDAVIERVLRSSPSAVPAPAPLRTASTPPNDPMHLNRAGSDGGTWANWRVGAVDGQAWSAGAGGTEVVLAVVDTGCRYTHQDLADNMIEPAAEFPYNEPGILTDTFNKDNDPNDDHGHGTYCAGITGAVGNNGVGLSGMNQVARILPVKVLSGGGWGTETNVAEGMLLADYLGADIISMSLGDWFPVRIMQLAARQCDMDGMLVVAAAGNNNWGGPFYPAYYNECVAVGATTLVNDAGNEDFSLVDGELPTAERFDARAGFSCYGDWVELAAPGVQMRSTAAGADDAYGAAGAGTSFACPCVAGCAALLWSHIGPQATNSEVRGLLLGGATVMDHVNNGSNPRGFLDNDSNGPVRFVNVWNSIQLYDGGLHEKPQLSWHNPAEGSSVSGLQDLQLEVSGGSGNIVKVDFDTPNRHIGSVTAPSGGYWQLPWDTAFEFNRSITVTATAYDDLGLESRILLHVSCDNAHVTPGWGEAFDGVADNALPAGWTRLNGNSGPGDTAWGADASVFGANAPGMHTSGSSPNYGGSSNDWLFAPIVDLRGVASASLEFDRRFQTGGGLVYLFLTRDDETYGGDTFASGGLVDWDTYSYDLTPWCGSEVRIFWVLIGGGSAPGLWLDDLSIDGPEGTPPTVQILSPGNGGSVAGMVPVTLLLSDDTVAVEAIGSPVHVGGNWYTELPDNDPGNPTKTFSFDWDSRITWNGPARLRVRAFDDEGNDGGTNDLVAEDEATLSVGNPLQQSGWLEDFEAIGDLGGVDNGAFDGDWFRWGGDSLRWRTDETVPWRGLRSGYFGPAGGGSYGANDRGLLYSPVFDLSAASHPWLRLRHMLDVEAGNGDQARIYLVRQGEYEDLEGDLVDLRNDTVGYERLLIDLDRYKATPFRLLFLFQADNDAEAGSGWWLDDIEVLDGAPAIFSVFRARGYPGQEVVLNGSHFGALQDDGTVSFAALGGGRTEAVVTAWSDSVISVIVPPDATGGDILVNVLGQDSNPRHFSVLLDPTPLTGIGQF